MKNLTTKEKIMQRFKIIKDSIDENLFYVAFRDKYDDESELTIVSSGKTEKECLEKALEKTMEALKFNQNFVESISESMSHNNYDCDIKEDFYIKSEDVFGESEFEKYSYDALHFNEETGKYNRCCR